MADPGDVLRAFYDAFAARDGEAMARLYTPDATFEDPVFRLSGPDVGDMWRMLTERGKDLRVAYRVIDARHVEWSADYTFRGRPVHNEVRSSLDLDGAGRIARHVDAFEFPRWAGQALGWKGRLLGSFGFFQEKVRSASAETLASWQRRRTSSR